MSWVTSYYVFFMQNFIFIVNDYLIITHLTYIACLTQLKQALKMYKQVGSFEKEPMCFQGMQVL